MTNLTFRFATLILNDQIPDFDQVTSLTFSGAENYSIFYEPDSTASYSADDVYFTETGGCPPAGLTAPWLKPT